MTFSQSDYHIRLEWGLHGAELLSKHCDCVIIVDVLSFSTAVSIAVSRGGTVFPYPYRDDGRIAFAKRHNAILAGPRRSGGYSLSPASLQAVQSGERIVLPSPNGATIALTTRNTPTYTGCLRNAHAVATRAMQHGKYIGIIPCGERWRDDQSLRPALEDLIGAGAIITALSGEQSPEAQAAATIYQSVANDLADTLLKCSSGRELREMHHQEDISLAAQINVDNTAPRLIDGAFCATVKTL